MQMRHRRTGFRLVRSPMLAMVLFQPVLVAASTPPLTGWHEARVPGFVIVSDAGEGATRRLAARLCGWRNTFAVLWPQADPRAKPVVVLGFKSMRTLCALLPTACTGSHTKPAGLFLPGLDRDYLALALDAEGYGSSDVLGHEFAHLLLDRHVEPLPLWLDEGIAELVATGDMRQGLGAPNLAYLALLQQHTWLPLPSLLSTGLTSPGYRDEALAPIFYAEAWALVHYLELADGGEQTWRLTAFVALLARGVSDTDAAAQAFGDLAVLRRRLDDYVRSGRLQGTSLSLPLFATPQDPPARRLTAAEVALTLGDFLGHTDSSDEPMKLLERAGRDGLAAQSLERISLIELRRKQFDAARRHADEALALDSTLVAAHYARGAAVVAQPMPPAKAIDAAEHDLSEALKLDDGFAPAYSLLGTLLTIRNQRIDEALALIRRAVSLDPSVVMYRVALAHGLLVAGESEEAEHIAIRIVAHARSAQEREIGQKLLQAIAPAVAGHQHQ